MSAHRDTRNDDLPREPATYLRPPPPPSGLAGDIQPRDKFQRAIKLLEAHEAERDKSENDLLKRTLEYSQANERLKRDNTAQAERIRDLERMLNLPPPGFKHAGDCDGRSAHFASEHFPHICASDPRLFVKLNHLATVPEPASRHGLLPSERPRQDWSEGAPPNVCHMGTGGADRFCAKEHTTCPFWHFCDLPDHVYRMGSEAWKRGYERRKRDRMLDRDQKAGGKRRRDEESIYGRGDSSKRRFGEGR
ncbi:hypothetical protein BFW01_g7285 [Lasiodiplodia theobromae]|uniref:Uncharacterized protein n=1 Tax=Lasiodiplodia theobromae TaxID=45133 RepID=A0A5N5DAE8_9PEZI|nr:hypothetical protein DBV05_g6590 [Lasiodiplodia theobromae]KAF9636389.1 hypothetical protein BFW01_g7285 [Lasiodiplodia theobromae]